MRHITINQFRHLLTPVVTGLLFFAAAVVSVQAAVTTYSSRATYNSVVASMGTTKNIDFSTLDNALPITNPGNDIHVTSMFIRGAEFVNQRSYYNRMMYNFPNFKSRVNLPANTYAFGVDLTRFYGTNGNFTITLSTGNTYTFTGKPGVHYFTFPPNPDFFGVVSDQPVQWAEYTFPNDYFVLDDFTYTVNTPNQLSGLVSYWAGENTSVDIRDGNDGVLRNGIVFAPGAVGRAFSFDGTNRYVEVPDSANLSLTGPLTLEARIKLNTNTVQQAIIEKYDVPGLNGYLLRVLNGKLSFALCNANLNGANQPVNGATTITTGVWHHVAAVYDGTMIKVYLDGVLDGSAPANFAPTNGATSLKIGARGDDAATRFNGLMDDVRIYNRALSEAEIQTVMTYDSTPPVITPVVTGNQGTNDWYWSNVQVSWTVSDGESQINDTNGCGASNVTTDTAGVTFTCTATSLGGTTTQSVTIKRDSTPPNMTKSAKVNGNPYNGGWTNQNVLVTFECTDSLSGLDYQIDPTTVSDEGANQTVQGYCSDMAGNGIVDAVANINIDKTAPVINANRTPAANAAGWNNTNVTANYAASDALSGLAANSPANGSIVFSAEGAGQSFTFSVTDAAGNSASATVENINIDKTAPLLDAQATVNGQPYTSGVWTNQDVTVSFNCADALSGVGNSTSPAIFSAEGINQSSNGTCSDNAGNSSEATFSGINIDKTAPVIDANRTPAANAAGWNNTNVTASYAASDALSGLAANSPANGSFEFTTEGAGQSHQFTVFDAAGNSASVSIDNVNIDKTAPTVNAAATVNGQPYVSGSWANQNVSVSFNCSDALSGAGETASPQTFSSEGMNQTATGGCTDLAGNSAETTFSGINIDKTAPSIDVTRTPAANAAGWNNGDVTANYAASDALSGLAANSPANGSYNFTSEGAGQSHTFTLTDAAGNTASATVQDVNIDKTAPGVSCGTADGIWHAADVSIACTASDALSSLANAADASFNLVTSVAAGTETANASTDSRQVCDKAGNCATGGAVGGNKVDKKAPSITITAPTAGNYLLNQAVTVDYSCTDGGSGVGSCPGTSPNGGLLDTSTPGAKTFTVSATDNVGNQAAPSNVSYTVGYGISVLFDQTKAHKAGSTVPVKIRLTDAAGLNVSSAGTVVHAVSVIQIGSQASTMLEDSGNSNPDFDFRFDPDSASYIFNLQTKGYRTGTYRLNFIAGSGAVIYSVQFQVRQ